MAEENAVTSQEATPEIVSAEATEQEAKASPETENPEADGEGDGEEETPEQKESRTKSRNQQRKEARQRLYAEKEAAERAARDATEKAERMRQAVATLKPPKLEDFGGNYDEWNAANTAFHVAKGYDDRQIRELEETARQHVQRVSAAKQAEIADAVSYIRTEGPQKYPDFEQVALGANVRITPEMLQLLAGSDAPVDVAYMLGKDPALAARIADMDPVAQARAIGRLEAQASAPKPKAATTAPDPVTPVRPRAGGSKRVDEMTPSEYRAWREAGGIPG